MTDEILDLQATAGNRSVAAAISDGTVQRAPAQAPRNDGGVLTLDSGEVIPLRTATWSITGGVKPLNVGHSRTPEIARTKLEYGDLEITRARDGKSPGIEEILQPKERGHATLKLNQPSADGGLPAVELELSGVGFLRINKPAEDDPIEHFTLYVEQVQVAGQVKDDSKANAKAKARAVAHISLDGGPPTPVIRWERVGGGRKVMVSRAAGPELDEPLPSGRPDPSDPLTIRLEIPAGRTLDQVAATLSSSHRLNGTLTPVRGGSRMDLREMLVTEIKSTPDPAIVQVSLVAETFRTWRPND